MQFTHKTNLVSGIVGRENSIVVMEEKQVFSNTWSLHIEVVRVLIDLLSYLVLICNSDLTLFTHSSFFTFCPLSGIILDGNQLRIVKLCFQFMDLASR